MYYRKVIDYKLVEDSYRDYLEPKIIELLNKGYQPYGSLVVTNDIDSNRVWYSQVMVKYSKDDMYVR